jgi:hypothetical protein
MGRRRKDTHSLETSGDIDHRSGAVDSQIDTEESEDEVEVVDTFQVPKEVIDLSTGEDVEDTVEQEDGTVLVQANSNEPPVEDSDSTSVNSSSTTSTEVTDIPISGFRGTRLVGEEFITCSSTEQRVGEIVEDNIIEFDRQPGDRRTQRYDICREVEVPTGSVTVEFGARGSSCTQWVEIRPARSGQGFKVTAYWNTINSTPRPVDHYCRISQYPREGVLSLWNLISRDLGPSVEDNSPGQYDSEYERETKRSKKEDKEE